MRHRLLADDAGKGDGSCAHLPHVGGCRAVGILIAVDSNDLAIALVFVHVSLFCDLLLHVLITILSPVQALV